MKALPLMLAGMAAISIAAPSFAADAPSRTVEFRPAELATQAGRDALEERLNAAARQVCQQHGIRGVKRQVIEARCQEDALEHARGSLEHRAGSHAHARSRLTPADAG